MTATVLIGIFVVMLLAFYGTLALVVRAEWIRHDRRDQIDEWNDRALTALEKKAVKPAKQRAK